MLSQIADLFETNIQMFRKVNGQRKQVTYFLNGLVIFQCSVASSTNFVANSYAFSYVIIHHVGVMLKALMLSPLCFGSLYDFGGLVLVIQEYACVTCVSHSHHTPD